MTDTNKISGVTGDVWYEWLLADRHGGDLAHRQAVLDAVNCVSDRVLDGAQLSSGMTMVDVGAGEGQLTFRAIDRIGSSLSVVLTDISALLLHHSRGLAEQRGVVSQCRFLQASSEKLLGLQDESVDVVTTRASLAYVADKSTAIREFYRVLRTGGRVSLAEPVMQDDALELCALSAMIQNHPNHPDIHFLRLLHRLKSTQFPSTEAEVFSNPTTNYTERDLARFLRDAGFADVHVELHLDVRPYLINQWQTYLCSSPHPLAQTTGEILASRFTETERAYFEKIMRPSIEAGKSQSTEAVVYATGRKI